ncbi:MAG: SMI1/KNR4 family protein [Pseudomonadota bacterium]
MGVEQYREALDLLDQNGIKVLVRFPAAPELVEEAETRLGHRFPPSYRLMLEEFGLLLYKGTEINGIGKAGLSPDSKNNVVSLTASGRETGDLSDKMVRFMSSGYGPYFVLDCSEADAAGEAPVYELSLAGQAGEKTKVAPDFGTFLLNEVKASVERIQG